MSSSACGRTGLPLEIIVVDDGSRDGTREKLAALPAAEDLRIVLHDTNRGKGAALRTGFELATGTAIVVQDADLEYDPDDFRFLIQPIIEGQADVVYGTRYGHHDRPVPPLWHVYVNRLITRLANLRTGLYLSDVETCYKVVRRELLQELAPGLKRKSLWNRDRVDRQIGSSRGTLLRASDSLRPSRF